MSVPQPSKPAKLIIGFFTADKTADHAVASALICQFGPVDAVSRWFPFDYTDYYRPEMGGPLSRRMLAFARLIDPASLAAVKLATNAIEARRASDGRRSVNIDPGYLVHERFVLATGKNFTHRIYLQQGIYADLTLMYQKGGFRALPWTYPDYAAADMTSFLQRVRLKYILDLKGTAAANG